MAKPFIAARVPQIIEDKLNERIKGTGLGKTEIIVNALAEYLGCSINVPEETRAVDRLVDLEKELVSLKGRITTLEQNAKQPVQKVLFDNSSVIKADTEIDNISDKNTENKSVQPDGITLDNTFDNNLLTNKQIAELSGLKFETVKSRHRKNSFIEWADKRYIPIREGRSQKWRLDNTP